MKKLKKRIPLSFINKLFSFRDFRYTMGKGTKEEHSVYLVHDSIPQRGERKHGRRYQKRAVY